MSKDKDKYKRVNKGGAVIRKGKWIGKIFGIALVFAMIGAMLGDMPVLTEAAEASPATIYVPDNYSTIQAAVNAASLGATIIVRDGTYTEYEIGPKLTRVSLTPAVCLVYQADLSNIEPSNRAELMDAAKRVIERRINALGITEPIIAIQEQGAEWSIAIQLPDIGDTEKVKELIMRVSLLEFREQDEEGDWIPATGTVNDQELILSSRYIKENTYITVDQYGRPLLIFEWDETGQELSQQITSRLIGKPLAIYLGDEPLRGEDGNPIAPVVGSVIRESGQIEGLSLEDAQELSMLLNAGHIPVPLGRWVEEGQSKVFEPNVPLYEGQAPDQAVHTSPANGAIDVSLTPTFQWQLVSGATKYGLYVSKPPYGEANLVYENENVTGTSLTLPSGILSEGITYRWNMRSHSSCGWGPLSSAWSFTTEQEEVALTLYVHENSASGPVIVGARVTGQDGAGNSFDQTTKSSGYVTITGTPGTWSFTASKSGYNSNSWSQDITATCTKHAYLTMGEQPNCVITLEQCQSGAYIDPHLPLCWEISGVGIGDSFSICVSNSTASNGIKEVRFSSDDSQDGNPSGQWTQWYDWNVSSGDWSAQSKSMSWSCSTGGEKEIWVELKDNADQTSQCFADITVVRFELPDVVSLDDIQISQWISSLVKYVGIDESWPVFLKGTLPFGNIPINIVLICSKNYPTEFKLVRIKTDLIEDPSDLSLSVVLPSSGVSECIETYVPRLFADWITNFGETLAKKILSEIAIQIAGTALDMNLPGIGFVFSVIDCVVGGYETTLEGWEIGKDYMVYLPMGVDLTIKAERGFSCYAATSPVLIAKYCPSLVRGQWTGSITERSTDIKIDIEEVDTAIFKLYSPAELRVYDSLGRVTGLVHGEIREEIPDSVYEPEIEVVAIFSPTDVYSCEVVGTEEGNYGLACASVKNGQTIGFAISNASISTGTVHQYSIDWDTLSTGGPGITVRVDSDDDGTFEQTTAIQPPIASFVSSAIDPVVSGEVTFDASESYDPDGEIVSYEWNFGDGNTSTDEIVTHAYSVPGEYLVSLVVVDNDGVVSTHSRTIQVGERQGVPIWGWAIIAIGIFVLAVIVLGRRRSVKA